PSPVRASRTTTDDARTAGTPLGSVFGASSVCSEAVAFFRVEVLAALAVLADFFDFDAADASKPSPSTRAKVVSVSKRRVIISSVVNGKFRFSQAPVPNYAAHVNAGV